MRSLFFLLCFCISTITFGQKYQASQKTYVKEVEGKIDTEKVTTRGNFIFEIKDNIIFLTGKKETLRYPIEEKDVTEHYESYKVQNGWSIKIINKAAIVIRWSDKASLPVRS